MKKLLLPQHVSWNPFSLFAVLCLFSCTNQEKESGNSFYKIEYTKGDPIIDFNTIDCLNESNQKAIELISISLRQSTDLEMVHVLLKIKIDHKKINSDFKKLTNKNLIIIPKPVYQLDINEDSINNDKSGFYILKKLKTEIKNQITSFDSIEKNTQNIDFKLFALHSKKTLQENNKALATLLSN